MHRRIKIWQRQIAISMQSIPKSVIETVDLRKSYILWKWLYHYHNPARVWHAGASKSFFTFNIRYGR